MKKFFKAVLAATILSSLLAGCGQSTNSNNNTAPTNNTPNVNNTNISGNITINGSTSMEKFTNALTESFMLDYPNINATVEFTGSGSGIEAVANETADIGNSSRSLKEEELAKGIIENIVAIDGIGVIIDKTNTVTNLTKDQLINIYNGTTKNWNEIGGENQHIVVIGREASSGTRGAFEELLKLENACKYAQEIDSTGAVMAKVASTPGAIGYVSLDVIDDTVIPLSLDDVEPTVENIKAGTYFLSRPFVMATKGEISKQSEAVQTLFEYIESDKGQEIIQKVGLIYTK